MEEYLNTLLDQVRCKKAHSAIREEILSHIEDQIKENRSQGMEQADAEAAAVKDMGNPVEAGILFDRIHRPEAAWDMILFMAMVTSAGILIHTIMGTPHYAGYAFFGFLLMVLVYRLDYTWIAGCPKRSAVLFFLFCEMLLRVGGVCNGASIYLDFGAIQISLFSVLLLYVPLYGAVIYSYYGQGYMGLFKALVWMVLPVFHALRMPCLPLAAMLLFSLAAVLTIAIQKGWFAVSGKKVTAALWSVMAGLPVLSLVFGVAFLSGYQTERLRGFLTNSGEANYVTSVLRSYLTSCRLAGNSGWDIAGWLPGSDSSFIFTYLISSYGLIAGFGVCAALAFLVLRAFSISFRQKNQLGMIMGAGSAVILSVNIAVNLLENIGLLPVTRTFLPFFSAGGDCTLVCYIMTGIILSVYRYKNVHANHVKTKRPAVKMTADPD